MNRNLITFKVGGETFGLDSTAIQEIRAWTALTRVPGVPDYVAGMVNWRGAVLPVVDLSIRLGWIPTEIDARHAIIIIQNGGQQTGLIVEAVSDMISIAGDALQPPPDFTHMGILPFIDSLAPIEDRLIMILDPAMLGMTNEPTETCA